MQNNVVVAADITLTLTVSQKGKKKRKKEHKDKHSYNEKPSSGHLFCIKEVLGHHHEDCKYFAIDLYRCGFRSCRVIYPTTTTTSKMH